MNRIFDESKTDRAPRNWMHEAIQFLGLARPDLAMHRVIKKGALHPRKICGRLAFDKKELELVASVGDEKRDRGSPNKFM